MPLWLKPPLRPLSVILLVAGIACILMGLGPKFYGKVGDPQNGFLKIAAVGIALLSGSIWIDRLLARQKVAAERRGFAVEFRDEASRRA